MSKEFAVYGDHEGAEIIGAAQNAIVLHINATAPKTAQWCSDVSSSRRDQVRTTSNTMGDKGASHGMNTAAQLVPNVYPFRWRDLKFYSFTNADDYRVFSYPWRGGFLGKRGVLWVHRPRSLPAF